MKDNGVWALPNSWAWTTIGQVAETTSGGTPSRKHPEYYGGEIPWVKSGELNDATVTRVEECITEEGLKQSSAKLFPQGTPVVALYGATVGRTAILGLDASTNQAICAIFALQNAFISSYILYWLQFQRPQLIELSTGGAQPNISQRIVRAFHFPLAPLPEQQRIVAEIETQFTRLEAGVAALKRAQANLRRYKASVLKAACEGRLVPTEAELARSEGREYEPAAVLLERILVERRAKWEAENPGKKYKEPNPPDTSGLPKLPEGWVWATVEQVSEMMQYGTSEKADLEPAGIPVLRMGNIQDGRLDFGNLKFFPRDWPNLDKFLLQRGDVLFNRTNSAELVGKSAVYKGFHPPATFASYLIRVRANRACLPDYLCYCINSYHGRSYIASVVSQQVGQANVSGTKLSRMPIPVPPSLEQLRIAAEVERRLSVVGEMEKQVEAALRRAERLRQAILKHAFEGKLVPQDPNDEPAPALLARIKAEQSGQGGQDAPKGSRQMRLPMP